MPNNNGALTPATTTSTLSPLPFVLPNIKGLCYKPNLQADKPVLWTLESVRDRLKREATFQRVEHKLVDLNTLRFTMIDGTLCVYRQVVVDGQTKATAPVPMHSDAWRQLYSFLVTPTTTTGASRTLPEWLLAHATHGKSPSLDVPVNMAVGILNYLCSAAGSKPVTFIVKNRKFGDAVYRIVSGVVGPNYVSLSHVDYVNALLSVPEMRNCPVVDFRSDDRKMYLRVILDDVRGGVETRKQYRTFDGWNGESGHRSYGGTDGLFKFICLNGMGNYKQGERFSYPHVGSRSPAEKIRAKIRLIQERGTRSQEAYDAALMKELADGFAFMEGVLNGEGFSDKTIAGVRNAMLDDTSTKYGTLANVIDGMTLFAQEYTDVDSRESLERVAHKIMVTTV